MSNKNSDIVKDGFLKTNDREIPIGSLLWFEWLTTAKKFSFKHPNGGFIAQHEIRRNNSYWYAYKRHKGKLQKAYLGKTEELTFEKLQLVSSSLTGNTPLEPSHGSPTNTAPLYEPRIDSSFFPSTKVTAPTLPSRLVTRTRLKDKINTPITLIYAPSGFGKSTLLNDWKQTCGYEVAWLALDEHDNNPTQFLYSVVTAFQVIRTDFGKDILTHINSFTSLQPTEAVYHLTKNILALKTVFPRLGFVLDDFHRINHATIYDMIQVWVEHCPMHLQLVISGHTRPPLFWGHLRAQGLLTELDVNDLRFTPLEGINYLQQYPQDPPLAHDDLEKLVKHTEGWAAGLTLTALAMGKQSDQQHFLDTFSGAHIYMREYFMETVFLHSTPEVQSFLLQTAILKNLTGSLCNAVTERSNGNDVLEYLWRENLFIIRLEEQGWYRYHDLFAEMLSSQLYARYPDSVAQLHQRAAKWYREQYSSADAIYHLLSIEAWEEAAALIEEMALRELERFGEDSRLLRWLQNLPESVVQKHKDLLFVYIRLANNALSQKKIEKFIQYIERNISSKPEALRTPDEVGVLAELQAIRRTWAQGYIYIPPDPVGKEHDIRWDLLNHLYILKPAYIQCQEYPEEMFLNILKKAQEQNNLFVILMAGGALAKRLVLTSQLRRAEKICKQILEKAMRQRNRLPETASIALNILGNVHFERNELELAQKYLAQSLEVDPNPTSPNMPIQNAILRTKIQTFSGKHKEALATIQTARKLNERRPSGAWTDEDLLAHEICVHIRSGCLDKAEELLQEVPVAINHHLLQQMRAELLAKKKQLWEAEEILRNLISIFPTLIVIEPLQEAHILLALVLFWQNKVNQSVQVMAGAIRLAAPEQFIRPFLQWRMDCAPIFLLVSETQVLSTEAHSFLGKLLARPVAPRLQKDEMDNLSTSVSISIREQEILQLLGEGYANREISKKLSVSESTVKTHIENIYTKLKVNSRMLAVSRARQLKIIP